MNYYNRDLKKFDPTGFEYLNRGSCGHISYNKNIIFKQYFASTKQEDRLSEHIFDILKDINNPHFIKLIDIYSKNDLLKLFFNKLRKKVFLVDAYSAKYYENENINVLNEPIDYLLDNIREIEILIDIFSDNAVMIDDIHRKNVIFTSQKMIIIDPDFFKISNNEDLIIINKMRLLDLIKDILYMIQLEQKYTAEIYYKIKKCKKTN